MDTDGFQFANPIDDLTYMYDTDNKNQLLRVFDATANPGGFKDDTDGTDINIDINEDPDYRYDLNGNMTADSNKGILEITYNHLNLPTEIIFSNGKINYLYNAVGQKVNKKVTQGSLITNTDYLSGFQYKNNFLQFFPHAEGYVNATQNGIGYTFHYVFNFTDHLGNIRLSYSKDPANNVLKIIEENHYYPFGLKHSGYNSDRMMYVKEGSFLKIKPVPPLFKTVYDKKYNGKSWETELGLNFYDYGARNYDPALGRWMNVDPLAEKMRRHSPYNYAFDNPVYFIDPDGMAPDDNDGGNPAKRRTTASHTFLYDTNKKGVKLEVGTDYITETSVTYTSSVVKGKEVYTTISSTVVVSVNAEGEINKKNVEQTVNINTTISDGKGNMEYSNSKLCGTIPFSQTSKDQQAETNKIATQKLENGTSPLQDQADNINLTKDLAVGTVVTIATGGASLPQQIFLGGTSAVASNKLGPSVTAENIKNELYSKTETLK